MSSDRIREVSSSRQLALKNRFASPRRSIFLARADTSSTTSRRMPPSSRIELK